MSLLRMSGICKVYSGVTANKDVSFAVEKGEIRALLGENGAGKTTLMQILCGVIRPTAGEIFWKDQKVTITSPQVAQTLGITMVHQHQMLVYSLTVAENVMLGIPGRKILAPHRETAKRISEFSERIGLHVDPNSKVANLSLGMRQRVEIIRALYRGVELLVLDEPTAVLTPQETEGLFSILKGLAAGGCCIIIISHKLDEIIRLCDTVSILRDGTLIDTQLVAGSDKDDLARMMVGRPVSLKLQKEEVPPAGRILETSHLRIADDRGQERVRDVGFTLKGGEIVGLAGIEGNGQKELAEALFGIRRVLSGSIHINGIDATNCDVKRLHKLHVGRVPEDRQRTGLILDMTLEENFISGLFREKPYSIGGVLAKREIRKFARELIASYQIKSSSSDVKARSLSGGNQQKVILARELWFGPRLLIIVNPTRGVDIGATQYIYRRIMDLKKSGAAVLLISSDLEEILSLSDRVMVIFDGRIMGEVDAKEDNIWTIGRMMIGKTTEQSDQS